jgi:hypothetical protein
MTTKSKNSKKSSTKELNRKLICKDLHKILIDWRKEINAYDKKSPISEKLNTILANHFSKVMEIIRQYVINDGSPTAGGKNVGGQQNVLGREFFREEVNIHKVKSPKTEFPSWKVFDRELEKYNRDRMKNGLPEVKISSRSYDAFKEQWRNGEFNFPIK